MIDKILSYANNNDIEKVKELENEVISSSSARCMFLYLYYVSCENLNIISHKILDTKDFRYIHFLLRSFMIDDYNIFIEFILINNNDSRYLFNVLYDVDYLDNNYRLKIINKIITLGDDNYIFKALYYYFIILNLFDDELLCLFNERLSINVTKDNYKTIFENILSEYDNTFDHDGFTNNCFKGRNGYIPNIINSIEDNANYYTFSIEHESFDGSLTDEQLKASIEVMKKIIKYLKDKYDYDFIIDRNHIIGHNEVNPVVRKKCPGNKFPFDDIISNLTQQ